VGLDAEKLERVVSEIAGPSHGFAPLPESLTETLN
jgi:hypothetical protein